MSAMERRFDMIKYLCKIRYATMPTLAKKYGVDVRTIKRDIDIIGDTIPLKTKAGRFDGGVYVMEEYYWDIVYMEENEIALLKRIREVAICGITLNLDANEILILDSIITTYTKRNHKSA